MPFLAKAVAATLAKYPEVNSSLDGDELVLSLYYYICFAADTPNGLVLAVSRDVDSKGVAQIASEAIALAARGRDGKLLPTNMQGGCFSVSSLGGIGGTGFTPIMDAPEVVILGVTRARLGPVWSGTEFQPRLILPQARAWDHRVVDGAAAARFLVRLAVLLADFRRVSLLDCNSFCWNGGAAMSEQIFPLNAWYAAGWRHEIGESLTPRVICELAIVLFRRRDGGVSALEDVCKHRLAPLSLGRLEKDQVICGYHGMTFAASGKCVRMPGAANVTPSEANCVRAFPVVERHKLVWIWPGNANKADPSDIPDLHWADDPDWVYGPCYIHMACDYRLVLDNLMDLTHETYVHPTSIGQTHLEEAPFEVTAEGKYVSLRRFMTDIHAPPFLAAQLKRARGLPPQHVDRWQNIRFEAPSTIVIDVGVAPTGTGAAAGDYATGVNTHVLNTLTPGRTGEAHYYFTLARNFDIEDAALTESLRTRNVEVFMEDKAMLEAQQRTMTAMPGRSLQNFGIDPNKYTG